MARVKRHYVPEQVWHITHRCYSTAIETGEHLLRCLVHVDLNMVRAGVVQHPSEWSHGGYNEIQNLSKTQLECLIDQAETAGGVTEYGGHRFRNSTKQLAE